MSFYRFIDIGAQDFVVDRLKRVFEAMGVLGRVYIASEGINAQICVPTNLFRCLEIAFMEKPEEAMEEMPDVAEWASRWIPREVRGVSLNVDRVVSNIDVPFVDLRIKLRHKVLADGLDKPLDWLVEL